MSAKTGTGAAAFRDAAGFAAGPLAGAVILLAEGQDSAASVARASLRREGALKTIWRRSARGLEDALKEGGIDLAFIDVSLSDGDAIDIARRVRHGELGENPFLPIVITSWRADAAIVKAALDAGADDVLVKPYAATMAASRIQRLGENRKPFIAAGGYIGPMRAKLPSGVSAAQAFEPPNPLKVLAKGADDLDPLAAEEALETAHRRLASARLEACVRGVAEAAGAFLKSDDETLEDRQFQLRLAAKRQREVLSFERLGEMREAVLRLASLADLAASGADRSEAAARLAIEIAEAVTLTIHQGAGDILRLPDDIVKRIDKRFPTLMDQ